MRLQCSTVNVFNQLFDAAFFFFTFLVIFLEALSKHAYFLDVNWNEGRKNYNSNAFLTNLVKWANFVLIFSTSFKIAIISLYLKNCWKVSSIQLFELPHCRVYFDVGSRSYVNVMKNSEPDDWRAMRIRTIGIKSVEISRNWVTMLTAIALSLSETRKTSLPLLLASVAGSATSISDSWHPYHEFHIRHCQIVTREKTGQLVKILYVIVRTGLYI